MKSNLAADYINKNFIFGKEEYEYIRPEIESRLFHRGDPAAALAYKNSTNLIHTVKSMVRRLYVSTKLMNKELLQARNFCNGKNIISTGYFSIDKEFEKNGYMVFRAPWQFGFKSNGRMFPNYKLYAAIVQYEKFIKNTQFYDLLNSKVNFKIHELKNIFCNSYEKFNINSFISSSSYPVYDRMTIDVLNKIGKRSFLYQHGLPGVYDAHMKYYDDTYDLIVWGEAFKDKYISLGMRPSSIHVAGHSLYSNLNIKDLRFGFDRVLIISKACPAIRIDSDDNAGDGSASLLYLLCIKEVLQKVGVKNVYLRPHPSENINWYREFIDPDFFILDDGNLVDSLKKSSLVIGPTSTTFIDATYYGVNYVVFEPEFGVGKDLFCNPIVFPFDGSDGRIAVAKNEDQLYEILKKSVRHNLMFWADYVRPAMNLESVINKIKEN